MQVILLSIYRLFFSECDEAFFCHLPVSLMSQSAPPEMLQKLTYLVLRHHPKINRVDTVRAYTFGVLYFVEVCIISLCNLIM